jgi:hypothetical protein
VEGKLECRTSLGGSRSTNLINNSYTLWSHMTSEGPCLPQIPFSTTLPCTFQDGNDSKDLPPSYHIHIHKLEELFVKSAYQLHVIVSRVRHEKLQDIWLKKQQYVYLTTQTACHSINLRRSIIIPFNYLPRTRAPRPIVATPYFFSSVKTSPEEWHQALTCFEMRRTVEMGPIVCHVCFLSRISASGFYLTPFTFIDSSSSPLVEYMALQTPSNFIYNWLVFHVLYIRSSLERIWIALHLWIQTVILPRNS